MKLYLLKQYINNDYDTFDSCVVAAENEDDARTIHPISELNEWMKESQEYHYDNYYTLDENGKVKIERIRNESFDWVRFHERDKIEVEYLGDTHLKRGVICASFNAG